MTYYVRLAGQEYFSRPCKSIEDARIWGINHWDAVKKRLYKVSDRSIWGFPIYASQGAKKPYGYVIGLDAFYYVKDIKGEIYSRKILSNGKLKMS